MAFLGFIVLNGDHASEISHPLSPRVVCVMLNYIIGNVAAYYRVSVDQNSQVLVNVEKLSSMRGEGGGGRRISGFLHVH